MGDTLVNDCSARIASNHVGQGGRGNLSDSRGIMNKESKIIIIFGSACPEIDCCE